MRDLRTRVLSTAPPVSPVAAAATPCCWSMQRRAANVRVTPGATARRTQGHGFLARPSPSFLADPRTCCPGVRFIPRFPPLGGSCRVATDGAPSLIYPSPDLFGGQFPGRGASAPVPPYRPTKLGCRFSRNARAASLLSSPVKDNITCEPSWYRESLKLDVAA